MLSKCEIFGLRKLESTETSFLRSAYLTHESNSEIAGTSPLGIGDWTRHEDASLPIEPSDMLLLYTDAFNGCGKPR